MSATVLPSKFSIKSVSISPVKVLKSGAKQAYMNYDGGRLTMQTAIAMSVPFGLGSYDGANGTEYSVELSFRGQENRPELKEFMKVMEQLDEMMINEGVKNAKTWFKADLGKDVIKAFYTPCIKYSKDKQGNVLPYPPNIKLKLPKYNKDDDGEFDTKFYDKNGTPYKGIPVKDLLVKGVQVTAIMECGGVWFAGSKYGLTWRAKQIAIHKLPEKLAEFAFQGISTAEVPEDDEEEEDANEVDDDAVFQPKSSAVAAVMPQRAPSPPAAQEVEDGDDIEPMVAPKKPVLKKKLIVAAKK
jgi:hypothetical protein